MRQIQNSYQLGLAIRAARKRAGINQADLARKAGVSVRWLSQFESTGYATAEIGRAFAVINALGMELQLTPMPEPRRATGTTAAAQEALRRRREQAGG